MSSILTEQGLRSAEGGVGPVDERPLTDEERKLVNRLFSDPFSFPQTFKTWLIAFLEGSDLTLPLGSVNGLLGLIGAQGGGSPGVFGLLPAGMLFPFAGTAPPNGTLWADGSTRNRTDYERLYQAIGTQWGNGNGSPGSFSLPDYRERMLMGAGPRYGVASTDGRIVSQRGPSHFHMIGQTTSADGTHSHGGSVGGVGDHTHSYQYPIGTNIQQGTQGAITFVVNAVTGATSGGGGAHGHGLSIDGVGPHTHYLSGPTSGQGGAQDQPAYGACLVIINY